MAGINITLRPQWKEKNLALLYKIYNIGNT